MKIGYKATYDFTCRHHKFEIGQTYELSEKPIMCLCGFHYCKDAKNTLRHYNYNSRFKLLEIEDLGLYTIERSDKSCTNKIRIIREINDPNELIQLLEEYRTFNENGKELTHKDSTGYWHEYTYDQDGKELTFKDSNKYWHEYTYDQYDQILTYKDSTGYYYEFTYDQDGNKLTYKDSDNYVYDYTCDEGEYAIESNKNENRI